MPTDTVSTKRLLILDDEPTVANMIALIAGDVGFEVQSHQDPVAFLEAVRARQPSHIALDLIMPGMDGVEVLRHLAGFGCEAALILTSGLGRRVLESARATADERGLNILGVLPKPFSPKELRTLLVQDSQGVVHRVHASLSAATLAPHAIAQALEAGRITIAVQPKLALTTRSVIGAEVLARWNDPERGYIPPETFIPVAEASGLMKKVTRAVLEQALDWFAGSPLRAGGSLAVNISTTCLNDVRLADEVQMLCLARGLSADQLILEITESSAMDRTADCFDTLTRLRLKRFRLSIDDFGTGYSSLAQLARLPLSELKIDRSFVAQMRHSVDARKIVDATIRLADSLGLISVAEGVDDASSLELLATLGCTVAQGFYIAPPMSTSAFDTWIGAQRHAAT